MNRLWRFVRFNSVGALGMAVQLSMVWALDAWAGAPAEVATACGVTAAVVHNFLWHRHWTWGDRRPGYRPVRAFATFAAANGLVSLVGNITLVGLLTTSGTVGPVAANVAAIGMCSFLNFWTSEAVVFKEA